MSDEVVSDARSLRSKLIVGGAAGTTMLLGKSRIKCAARMTGTDGAGLLANLGAVHSQVGKLVHYLIRPRLQGAYASRRIAPDARPFSCRLTGEVLSLPIGPRLPLSDVARVIGATKEVNT